VELSEIEVRTKQPIEVLELAVTSKRNLAPLVFEFWQ
jgi:hypothetical protein